MDDAGSRAASAACREIIAAARPQRTACGAGREAPADQPGTAGLTAAALRKAHQDNRGAQRRKESGGVHEQGHGSALPKRESSGATDLRPRFVNVHNDGPDEKVTPHAKEFFVMGEGPRTLSARERWGAW